MIYAQAILELGEREIASATSLARSWAHARAVAGEHAAGIAFGDMTEQTEAVCAIAKWEATPTTPTLVLSGGNDSGKTIALVGWAGRARAMWMRADDLGRENWSGGALASAAMKARRLAVDDIGAETSRAREHTCAIICYRHDRNLQTAISTTLIYNDKRRPNDRPPGTIVGEYPDSMSTRLALGWRSIKSTVGGRLSEPVIKLENVRRAQEIERAAVLCRCAASGVGDPSAAENLRVMLNIKPDAVAAKVAQIQARQAAQSSMLADALTQFIDSAKRTP